ncbi:rhodanese-like domain-containing protein [bacterium]|nr:rhodanese-like domain-containing protein [bacterium]
MKNGLGIAIILLVTIFSGVGKALQKPRGVSLEILTQSLVIDVRSKEEYVSGHYPNAVNIPLDTIQQEILRLKADKRPIVVICRSGRRAENAVAILKKNGIPAINGINQKNLESIK